MMTGAPLFPNIIELGDTVYLSRTKRYSVVVRPGFQLPMTPWLETAAYHDPNLPHKEKFVKFAKISFLVMEACTSMPVFISTRIN